MNSDKTGRIVWHDLFTADAHLSQSFYERVAGWSYLVEHATNFAWGGGEGDYILSVLSNEAGAGIVEPNMPHLRGWVPYVEVDDVDQAAERCVGLCGRVVKPPFEVPGVGRNCLLCDPNGAFVGICFSRHAFPAPTKQFGPEVYLSQSNDYPDDFYDELFGWKRQTESNRDDVTHSIMRADANVGLNHTAVVDPWSPIWVPSVRVGKFAHALDQVLEMNGEIVSQQKCKFEKHDIALIRETNGTYSYLLDQQENGTG